MPFTWIIFMVCRVISKRFCTAFLAQQAARQSHNLKVLSSILREGIYFLLLACKTSQIFLTTPYFFKRVQKQMPAYLSGESCLVCLVYLFLTHYGRLAFQKIAQSRLEMPGIEPWASYMRSMRSSTELHPHIYFQNFCWMQGKSEIY